MRLWSLGSGSKGNALLLESGDSRVLIDAGFPARTLAQRLQSIGIAPASITDCVITHEHGDHCRGAAVARRKWGWILHATAGTTRGCPELAPNDVSIFVPGDTLTVGTFTLRTISSPHDASEPVVLVATSREGVRTGVAYDLGHVPERISKQLMELDLLVLESNHDEQMLRSGPYPPSVQARIASRTGHLSNRAAAECATGLVGRELTQVLLAHLSEKCNDHGLAVMGMRTALRRTSYRGQVSALPQHAVAGPFLPGGSRAEEPPRQLSLF